MPDNTHSGSGVYIAANGCRYEGDYLDSCRNGYGILGLADGGRYEGEFRNTKFCGYGVRIWANGSRYEGQFSDNAVNGYGVHTWSNGGRHEGCFQNGAKNGYGIEFSADGSVLRSGSWEAGKYGVSVGLNVLFKAKPGTLGMGLPFNEDTYAAAKAYFQAGVVHFKQDGADRAEMVKSLIVNLRDQFGLDRETIANMKPYIVRFMNDAKEGKITFRETLDRKN